MRSQIPLAASESELVFHVWLGPTSCQNPTTTSKSISFLFIYLFHFIYEDAQINLATNPPTSFPRPNQILPATEYLRLGAHCQSERARERERMAMASLLRRLSSPPTSFPPVRPLAFGGSLRCAVRVPADSVFFFFSLVLVVRGDRNLALR